MLDQSYQSYINDLKSEITRARIKAVLSVNRELVVLYWRIGKKILEMQAQEGWGAKVIDQISADLRRDFPEMRGLSAQNLKYMKRLAQEYSLEAIGQQTVDQLPWGHVIALIYKVLNTKERSFYIQKTIENGWSRNVLSMQIETNLYARQGKAITNFKETLPSPQSDLAHEIIKSPYNFEFLTIEDKINERNIEKALVTHIRDFMLELGQGFAFIGTQYPLKLAGESYFLDMLFYNIKLKAYTIIELKSGLFKPEYAGKMNFYLNVVDKEVRSKDDNPSIGIILCRDNNHITATYALDGIQRPLGVSEYTLSQALEERLKDALIPPPTHT
jgi:predicted nuclease of restriction endonuclease-like (RecB) superfamily